MAESCELARLLRFTIQALEEHNGSVTLYKEIADLASQILTAEAESCARWDRLNTRKEAYREETRDGFRGSREAVSCQALVRVLKCMEKAVLAGISKAKQYHDSLIPTYFIFTATSVVRTPDGPMPTAFQAEALPLFLEGPGAVLKAGCKPGGKESPGGKGARQQSVRQPSAYVQSQREPGWGQPVLPNMWTSIGPKAVTFP